MFPLNLIRTVLRSNLHLNEVQSTNTIIYSHIRFKSKGQRKQQSSESETEPEEKDYLDDITDKHTKTLKVNVNSLRLDAIIKSGLGISRNKIETIFYESKIRLNGQKVLKKSVTVKEGDEIDVIKGLSVNNPNFLTVARVEVLFAAEKDENISLKIRRNKSLLIENYEDKWKPS
ncbi:mitochondrial transcription rescue factor 1 [Aethina tumida]|uniref:mitochondrial transcription rescue factor 1 n=1 Tax=Aethina tumida TaxID=116153 RepID=UPI002148B2A7|nr:mitochondrial transcription rescue factor 1 [Aethina tumida]